MKQFTFMLGSSPYSGQDVDTVLGIARTALKKGHQVSVVASGDGTYAFLKDQRASGAPHAGNSFAGLLEQGARIDLWGTCFSFRGLRKDSFIDGAEQGSLKGLFKLLGQTDILINAGP